MKRLFSGAMLIMAVLSAGCVSTEFYAVSDTSGETGGITLVKSRADTARNLFTHLKSINYLIRDPVSGLFYGTVSRIPGTKQGGVATLRADESGRLEAIAFVQVNGAVPCHLALSPDGCFLYTANYSSASVTELPLENGIPQAGKVIPHQGRGAGKRQEKAHPHFVGFDPAGKNLHAVDLGLDQIKVYPWHAGRGIDTKAVEIIRLHAGAGPRHLVFSPDGSTIYVTNELDSTVSSFVRREGKWEAAQTIRSLNGVPETRNYPGAIRITKDGRFLFVSNRGHNSIALIETGKNGAMKLLETADCNGDFPRDIALSPDETEIIAANEKSGTVTFLMFDRENRKLVPKKEKLVFPRALGIYFRM